jgi:hypothetical protein
MNNRDKKPLQSKKFIVFLMTIAFAFLFTVTGIVGIIAVPQSSSAIVNLLTISLGTISGAAGLYVTGQSVVDFKINSNHNTIQENKTISDTKKLITEGKEHEFNYEGFSKLPWDKYDEKDLEDAFINIINIKDKK